MLFALGTNMGIRQMAVTGEHGVGEAELRHVRAIYVTRENLRAAVTAVVNATLEAATRNGGARPPAPRRTPSGSSPGTPT